ncbi:hypothetical protein llap_9329 [Limosa lapponica baueri]|uniref:Uncharacterized protein n=1 Tax=Limosa lapponica baueri TaxID=1758121 RepID=A0A2I0U2W4_LIMLA|nr:hypothetical protein llap_9329 [Limosa lapponica baueri]
MIPHHLPSVFFFLASGALLLAISFFLFPGIVSVIRVTLSKPVKLTFILTFLLGILFIILLFIIIFIIIIFIIFLIFRFCLSFHWCSLCRSRFLHLNRGCVHGIIFRL